LADEWGRANPGDSFSGEIIIELFAVSDFGYNILCYDILPDSLVAHLASAAQLVSISAYGHIPAKPEQFDANKGKMVRMSPTILIIEDDQQVRELVARYLERDGFHAVSTADGHGGLAAVAASHPALVLLDVNLPDIDGWSILRRLRQEGA
jgi:PleD family two-component response regulator